MIHTSTHEFSGSCWEVSGFCISYPRTMLLDERIWIDCWAVPKEKLNSSLEKHALITFARLFVQSTTEKEREKRLRRNSTSVQSLNIASVSRIVLHIFEFACTFVQFDYFLLCPSFLWRLYMFLYRDCSCFKNWKYWIPSKKLTTTDLKPTEMSFSAIHESSKEAKGKGRSARFGECKRMWNDREARIWNV